MLQQYSNEEGEDENCLICLNSMENIEMIRQFGQKYRIHTNFNHYAHYNCLCEWLRTNSICPICRININIDDICISRKKSPKQFHRKHQRHGIFKTRHGGINKTQKKMY